MNMKCIIDSKLIFLICTDCTMYESGKINIATKFVINPSPNLIETVKIYTFQDNYLNSNTFHD